MPDIKEKEFLEDLKSITLSMSGLAGKSEHGRLPSAAALDAWVTERRASLRPCKTILDSPDAEKLINELREGEDC